MSVPLPSKFFLDRITGQRQPHETLILFAGQRLTAGDLAARSCIDDSSRFAGRKVMVASAEPLDCALALIELDGVASRLVICPPGLPDEHVVAIAATAEISDIISDDNFARPSGLPEKVTVHATKGLVHPRRERRVQHQATEWVLLTSGTTGVPKMVSHTFETLTRSIRRPDVPGNTIVWASFNDMRRFSGLQMFLHALLSDSTLVLKPVAMAVGDFLPVLTQTMATHVSGTPTHWRKVLMFTDREKLKLQQITLVGEIADQPILDALKTVFPGAKLTHIYGSTESGTGFSIHDGLAGFPASIVGRDLKGLELRVDDGMLKVKSSRSARNYVGPGTLPLRDAEGFVETGDQVELVGDRYRFLGRKNGAVNIGGSRVHPEEVEAALNADPRVTMSAVTARKNPFTGAILVADVVLANPDVPEADRQSIAGEILAQLRKTLDAYKVPATIRFVKDLKLSSAGKLDRRGA